MPRSLGVNYQIIKTNELSSDKFINNPPERCYYCKKELFSTLLEMAHSQTFPGLPTAATKTMQRITGPAYGRSKSWASVSRFLKLDCIRMRSEPYQKK